MNNWGLLPGDVYALIIKREWTNHGNLQKRLMGERAFPISISLKLPTDKQAAANIKHFQSFIANWQKFQLPELVVWVSKNYRSLKNQRPQ